MWRRLVVSGLAFVSLARPVMALEGVGALADQLAAGTQIRLMGKTAPWAEVVVVEETDDRVIATAEIEPTGDFDFRFNLKGEILANLQIFGVDDVGVTTRMEVASIIGQVVLLPPTIVNDEADTSTTAVALTGLSYPGAEITLNLRREGGSEQTFQTTTNERGYWFFLKDDLAPGKYTATARSRVDDLVSGLSQEIYFEILAVGLPPILVLPRLPELVEQLLAEPELVSRLVAPVVLIPMFGLYLKDLLALLLKLVLGLLHIFGWRKERRRWGVVYDSMSKYPLNRAIVRLYEIQVEGGERLMETEVTGDDGEFAFLPKAGKYRIVVTRGGYTFPSVIITGKGRDGEYLRVYHGEVLEIREDEEVGVSVPMDRQEVKIEWWFYIKKYLGPVWRVFGWVLLVLGLLAAMRTILLEVSWINVLVVSFYIALIVWNLLNGVRRVAKTSRVLDSETGKGVANVSAAVYELEFARLIQRRMSDEKGRLILRLEPGRYRLEVAAVDYAWDKSRGYAGEELVVRGSGVKMVVVKIYVRRK